MSVLKLIRRTFGPNNFEGVSTAYKTLIRPILEYGCQVWNPHLVKHIRSIDSIQRRVTQVICGSEKECQERLGVLKWPSLELRKKFICLVQMYKIIFGHRDIDPHMFFNFNVLAKTRRNHNCVRDTRTQLLMCVGCSVHYWVFCAINNGGFLDIAFVVVVVVDTHLPCF